MQPSSSIDAFKNTKHGYFYVDNSSFNNYCENAYYDSNNKEHITSKRYNYMALIFDDKIISHNILFDGIISVSITQNKMVTDNTRKYYVYKNSFEGIQLLSKHNTQQDAEKFAIFESKKYTPFILFTFPIIVASASPHNELYFDGDDELPYHIDIIKVIRDNGGTM